MDVRDKVKKLKAYAPAVSIVLVAVCTSASLSGYKAPVYAVQESSSDEDGNVSNIKLKSEEKSDKTNKQKGSFDLNDGIYQGTGTGYSGNITVAVTVKDKQITAIDILSSTDDAEFFTRAKKVIDLIIEGQTLDVDVVSGATYSSNGIINAVKNALTGEKDSGETGQSQSGATPSSGSSTSVAAVQDASSYKDGTYYGTGTGFGGTLKVQVVISGGKISSIQIIETSDGSAYISKASSLINSIIANQSTNVDTVSGATYSSVGIIQAVRNALSQAAVNSASNDGNDNADGNNSSNNDSKITGTIPYNEGIYYGTAEGYKGDITVAVVIQEHTLKNILITKNTDDETFFGRAKGIIDSILKKQSTDVDTVSGATYSSKGIIEAVKNALKKAERATNGESLEEIDTTKLSEKISQAKALSETDYTEVTWAVFSLRLSEAEGALSATEQTVIDKALENLNTAMSLLEKKQSDDSTIYIDGTYDVVVQCDPDEDEDFESYNLSMSVTIRDDKIVGISNVTGDGDSGNRSYINRAANGTSSKEGMISKITNQGSADNVDVVSGATCSSNSIIQGCIKALEMAKRQ